MLNLPGDMAWRGGRRFRTLLAPSRVAFCTDFIDAPSHTERDPCRQCARSNCQRQPDHRSCQTLLAWLGRCRRRFNRQHNRRPDRDAQQQRCDDHPARTPAQCTNLVHSVSFFLQRLRACATHPGVRNAPKPSPTLDEKRRTTKNDPQRQYNNHYPGQLCLDHVNVPFMCTILNAHHACTLYHLYYRRGIKTR